MIFALRGEEVARVTIKEDLAKLIACPEIEQ